MRDRFGDFVLTFEICTLAALLILLATAFIQKPAPPTAP